MNKRSNKRIRTFYAEAKDAYKNWVLSGKARYDPGADNIAALWKEYYRGIFNCVRSDDFCLGDVPSDGGVIIKSDEIHVV